MDIVFISYKWSDISQNIVYNQLIPALSKYNIGYEVDKNDCSYMENIRYFEQRIGRGGKIVAVVSKEYLYSVHCMYEIASVLANGNPEGRLFLLIVDDFDRSDSEYGDLVRYWQQEKEKLSIFKSEFADIGKDGIEIEDRYISLICSQIGSIWSCICDYNTLTITDIAKNDFEMLRTKMGFKNNMEMINPDVNNITTGTEPNRKIVMTGKNAQYIEINSGNNININGSSEI